MLPASDGAGTGNFKVDDELDERKRERLSVLVPTLLLLISDDAKVGSFKVVDDVVEMRERERPPALGPGSRSRIQSMVAGLDSWRGLLWFGVVFRLLLLATGAVDRGITAVLCEQTNTWSDVLQSCRELCV